MLLLKISLILFSTFCFSENLKEIPELQYNHLVEDVFYPETIQALITEYEEVAKNNLKFLKGLQTALDAEAAEYQKLAYDNSENPTFKEFYLLLAKTIRSGGPLLLKQYAFDIEKRIAFLSTQNWYVEYLKEIKSTSEAYFQSISSLSTESALQNNLIKEYKEWSIRQINKHHLKLPSFSSTSKWTIEEFVQKVKQIAISFEDYIEYSPQKKLQEYSIGSIQKENRHSFQLFFVSLGETPVHSSQVYLLKEDSFVNVYIPKDTVKVLNALKDWKILYGLLGEAKYREANRFEVFLNKFWLYPLPNYHLKTNVLVFKFNSTRDCVSLLSQG